MPLQLSSSFGRLDDDDASVLGVHHQRQMRCVFGLGTEFIVFILFLIICFIAVKFGVEKNNNADGGGETACQHMVP